MQKSSEVSGNSFILPAELDDDRSIIVMGRRANILCLLVAAAIIWATFAPIDELVLANGEIIPTDNVTSVEHREGGSVDAIFVTEGQIVQAGETIIELNPITTNADLAQLEIQSASLALKLLSLDALMNGDEPDYGDVALKHPDLHEKEADSYRARRAFMDSELANLDTSLGLKRLEVDSLGKELSSMQRQLELEKERHDSLKSLYKDGYATRQDYLNAQSSLEQLTQSIQATKGRKGVAELQLIGARKVIDNKIAQYQKQFGEEQTAALSELNQVKEQLGKQRYRAERLLVKSPIHGVIQELAPKAIGEVVGAGELVARIVPVERQIVADVKVDPYDIGHIKAGDQAEINISTFDPSIYGPAMGTIKVLSPTTFTTEKGEPYYKAVIDLENNFIGEDETKRYLHAGMIVDAKIKTGSKSLMRYMLKPVLKTFDTSFSER